MATLNNYQLKNDEIVQLRVALIARINWLVDKREYYTNEQNKDYEKVSKELYICQRLLALLT